MLRIRWDPKLLVWIHQFWFLIFGSRVVKNEDDQSAESSKEGQLPNARYFVDFFKTKLFLVIRKCWIINKQTFLSLGYWYFILNNAGEGFFYLGNIYWTGSRFSIFLYFWIRYSEIVKFSKELAHLFFLSRGKKNTLACFSYVKLCLYFFIFCAAFFPYLVPSLQKKIPVYISQLICSGFHFVFISLFSFVHILSAPFPQKEKTILHT